MNETLVKVRNLEIYINKYGGDALISKTISKMFAYKINQYERDIEKLDGALRKFEHTYEKGSQEFYKEFSEGKLGDDMDFVEWSSLYRMRSRLLEKKAALEGMLHD